MECNSSGAEREIYSSECLHKVFKTKENYINNPSSY